MRRLASIAAAAMFVLALAPGVAATSRQPIDPATLIPPPNPIFDPECFQTKRGIFCTGVEESTFVNESIGEFGFRCGDRDVINNGHQTRTLWREHDAQGRVTKAVITTRFDERWQLDGRTGPRLHSIGRSVETLDYQVPGDPMSRTVTITGEQHRVSGPGGVIFRNTGVMTLTWDESEVLTADGQFDSFTDFDGAVARMCAAFGA